MEISDKPTFEQIVREHGSFIRRTLSHLGVRARDLGDVEQEVLRGVSRGLPAFDPSLAHQAGSPVRGWLFGICERQAASHRRTEARRSEVLLATEELDTSESVAEGSEERFIAEERKALLGRLLATLEPRRRRVLEAYEIDGLPMADIATIESIPVNTAWNRLRLAREDLRAAWHRMDSSRRRLGAPPPPPLGVLFAQVWASGTGLAGLTAAAGATATQASTSVTAGSATATQASTSVTAGSATATQASTSVTAGSATATQASMAVSHASAAVPHAAATVTQAGAVVATGGASSVGVVLGGVGAAVAIAALALPSILRPPPPPVAHEVSERASAAVLSSPRDAPELDITSPPEAEPEGEPDTLLVSLPPSAPLLSGPVSTARTAPLPGRVARAGSHAAARASSPPASASVHARPPRDVAFKYEADRIADAQSALDKGDVAAAERALRAHERAFRTGQMAGEREALMTRLLLGEGRRSEATDRARAFLAANPNSPARRQIEALLGKVD
ncbi:MAG: sigma-70 family RNA polymerase sigma factor [Polyangiaceae bacterium]